MLKLYDNLEDRIGLQKIAVVAEDSKQYVTDMFERYKGMIKNDYDVNQKMKSSEVKKARR